MTQKLKSGMPNEPRKRQDGKHEAEIEEVRNGLPKVIEYWQMVKEEMDDFLADLLTEQNNT